MDDNLKNGPRRSTTEMNEICVLSSLKPAGSEDSLHGVSRSNTRTSMQQQSVNNNGSRVPILGIMMAVLCVVQ